MSFYVNLRRGTAPLVNSTKRLSLGEYSLPGSPQSVCSVREAFLTAVQQDHQCVLEALKDHVLPRMRELTFPIFEDLVYATVFHNDPVAVDARRCLGQPVVLGRRLTPSEEEHSDKALAHLTDLLKGFNLHATWIVEQALVTMFCWESPTPPNGLPPTYPPAADGHLTWERVPTTWTVGYDETRHEWPPDPGDFHFWLGQTIPDPTLTSFENSSRRARGQQPLPLASGFAWDPVWMTRDEFVTEATGIFTKALNDYCDTMARHVESQGYTRSSLEERKALSIHAQYLAHYQIVDMASFTSTATLFGTDRANLGRDIKRLAKELGLPLKPQPRKKRGPDTILRNTPLSK